MKKIKVTVNDKVIALEFKVNILEGNILSEICKELELSEVYIDVFNVDTNKTNFAQNLIGKNNTLKIAPIGQGGYAIKATSSDISTLIECLPKSYCCELNVWNVYTDWEQYLKDKATYKSVSKTATESETKVYLNYNQLEGNTVELYLDTNYNAEKVHRKLSEIINL